VNTLTSADLGNILVLLTRVPINGLGEAEALVVLASRIRASAQVAADVEALNAAKKTD
jgi:hypothetical protein